jgi:Skp family chaperone for outer membrane proteins
MNIKVVDFEILTKNYTNYQTGIKKIEDEKQDFIKSLDPVKKEMESIIGQMSSGIILDDKTQKEKEQKFRSLQEQAYQIDNNFKLEMRRLHDDLNKKTFDELSEIIDTYSKDNNIDMVIGKMEVVFLKDEFEITNDVLEILKEKDLYIEFVENDYQTTQTQDTPDYQI